jgi:hypothetical protein
MSLPPPVIDLKFRFPAQDVQRFAPVSSEPPEAVKAEVSSEPGLASRYHVISAVCMLCLLPFVLDVLPLFGTQLSGCLYIMLSPVTLPSVCLFNLLHKNSKQTTIALALGAVVSGNAASILHCAPGCQDSAARGVDMGGACLSLALILGNLQLLMLMNKKNIAIVMISTASSVVVCGLAAAAPFLSLPLRRRCYQTSVPCIMWLFWQATQSHFLTCTPSKRLAVDSKI